VSIPNREAKRGVIIEEIWSTAEPLDPFPGDHDMLRPYLAALESRKGAGSVRAFIEDDRNMELVWKVLDRWMGRGSYLLMPPAALREAVRTCGESLVAFEADQSPYRMMCRLPVLFGKLRVIKAKTTHISTAKLVHLLFPDLLMPVDAEYVHRFFWPGAPSLSERRYLEIQSFQRSICESDEVGWDEIPWFAVGWNTARPKIVDNAIIVLMQHFRRDEE